MRRLRHRSVDKAPAPAPARQAGVGRHRRATWLAGAAAALLAAASPLAAQPAAVYELDTYLDPRALGSTIDESGAIVPGLRFWIAEALAGTISAFEHQGAFTEGPTEFAHVSTSFYSGRHQLNLLVTDFDPRDRSAPRPTPEDCGREPGTPDCGAGVPRERTRFVPDYRIRLQYGRYKRIANTVGEEEHEEESFLSRSLISAGYEEGPFGDVFDLGIVIDVPLGDLYRAMGLSTWESGFNGAFGYDWRIIEGGYDQHRLLYFYSWRNDQWQEGPWRHLSTPVRLSFGGERSEGHTRWAPVRLEAGLRFEIERLRTSLQVTYAPSWRPASRGFDSEVNHELAAFVDVVALAKILAPAALKAP